MSMTDVEKVVQPLSAAAMVNVAPADTICDDPSLRISELTSALEAKSRELERAHEQVRIAQQVLVDHEKMRALGQLVAGIAHELRNPLAGILGLTEAIVHDGFLRTEDSDDLSQVVKLALRCKDIVDNLLRFARKEELQKSPTGVRDLIHEALSLLTHRLKVDNVNVTYALPPDLPPMLANHNQLVQVVFNLAQNAVQAMAHANIPQRRIHFAAERDGAFISLTVTDSGPGIAAIDRLFEPFYTTKPRGEGTGLGLALARGIAEEHGGSITAENWPLGGARFRIRIPAVVSLPVAYSTPPEPARVAHDRPMRLLVVDDEEFMLRVVQRSLVRRGFVVEAVARAADARSRLEVEPPIDVVVTDLRMTDEFDGYALVDWVLSTKPELCDRLIVMTGDQLNPSLQAIRDHDAVTLLTKPFAMDELCGVILSKASRIASPTSGPVSK